ncbi:MAG: HD domain-containing protein [Polyangiaceae bacterium]
MYPNSVASARELLQQLGAPPHLIRHVELVGEAGERLVAVIASLGVRANSELVRVGIVVHDAGKILHPDELHVPGAAHEPAGQDLLLQHGVSDEVARICVTHAQWSNHSVSLEELLVALSDKLWKGVRNLELEERVVREVARSLGKDYWDLFVELDNVFEQIAADGSDRLQRSGV